MQLDNACKMSTQTFGMGLPSSKRTAVNSVKHREDIVDFLIYVRNYIQR